MLDFVAIFFFSCCSDHGYLRLCNIGKRKREGGVIDVLIQIYVLCIRVLHLNGTNKLNKLNLYFGR